MDDKLTKRKHLALVVNKKTEKSTYELEIRCPGCRDLIRAGDGALVFTWGTGPDAQEATFHLGCAIGKPYEEIKDELIELRMGVRPLRTKGLRRSAFTG